MDYTRFRFRAVVDWIEIEIRTEKPTNFQTFRRVGTLSYVKAQDEGAGGAASIFRFKIYDPDCWNDIILKIAELKAEHAFSTAPIITGIEIAFDAYSKGEANVDELPELAASYYRNMTLPVSSNRRLYRDYKGSGKAIPRQFSALVRDISEGWQIGVGDKAAEQYQHIYFKTVDHNGQKLPKVKHRARIEITLRGNELPSSIEEWREKDFTKVSRFFKFRKPKDNLDPLTQITVGAVPQIGERKERKRKEGGGVRLYHKPTQADKVLNEKASQALRNLTSRWKPNRYQTDNKMIPKK
jgi:hypothetical protein